MAKTEPNLREYWIEKFSQEFKGCLPTNNIRNRAGIRIARLADSMPSEFDAWSSVRRNGVDAAGFYASRATWTGTRLEATNKDTGSTSFWNGSGWTWTGH